MAMFPPHAAAYGAMALSYSPANISRQTVLPISPAKSTRVSRAGGPPITKETARRAIAEVVSSVFWNTSCSWVNRPIIAMGTTANVFVYSDGPEVA